MIHRHRQIRLTLEVLMKHHSRFHQLDSLEGFGTQFSESMLLEHMQAMVLDMVNKYKYLPELIIVLVGASDLVELQTIRKSQQWHAEVLILSVDFCFH